MPIFIYLIHIYDRRQLCGLPDEDFCEVPLRPNTDMEIWKTAVRLMKGKPTETAPNVLPESNESSSITPVY